MNKFVILIPSFNDWDCLNLLIPQIDYAIKDINNEISILIINDGSTSKNNLFFKKILKLKNIEVLNLKKNVKAQIAIATGLSYLKKNNFKGGIIVMDADGQDDPKNLVDIINEAKKEPEKTITINRTKRDDGLFFQILYQAYLYITFFLTWKYLKYGVYSYLHFTSLDKILSTNDINLAYVGSLAKHFRKKKIIYASRKKRILGKSQNNYFSLIHFALKVISVFKNRVLVTSLMFMLFNFLLFDFNVYLIIILLLLLFFNIMVFSIATKINKSELVKNILANVGYIESVKN